MLSIWLTKCTIFTAKADVTCLSKLSGPCCFFIQPVSHVIGKLSTAEILLHLQLEILEKFHVRSLVKWKMPGAIVFVQIWCCWWVIAEKKIPTILGISLGETSKTNNTEFCFMCQGVIILRQLSINWQAVYASPTLPEVILPTLRVCALLSLAASTSDMLSTIHCNCER